MSRKRRRRHRHNPIDATKIAWALGLTVAAVGIGVGVYYVTKKPTPPPLAAPPGSGGTVKPSGGSTDTGPAAVSPQKVAVATVAASAPAHSDIWVNPTPATTSAFSPNVPQGSLLNPNTGNS